MNNFFKIFQWPMIVLALHALFTITGSYWAWPRLDNLMHFLGGASIGMASLSFFKILENHRQIALPNRLVTVILAVAVTALTAVLWEFMELGMDFFFQVKMQPDLVDTMSDLALGLFGGIIISTINTLYASRK